MPAAETIITFFTASLLLAVAPGPDNIFVLTLSILRGRLAGLVVILGLCTGLIIHSTAVALGVAVIFQVSALAFSLLKWIGAGYLAYLAWQAFRAGAQQMQQGPGAEVSYRKLYGRGIIMNITNPKVSLFFLAFLPQFADPARGPVSLQILLLGALFILATIIVFGAIALLSGTLGQWFRDNAHIQKRLHRIAGAVFLGLALKLITTER
ncbi:MAG: LysE family translocator [Pseudomonadota bacterium]